MGLTDTGPGIGSSGLSQPPGLLGGVGLQASPLFHPRAVWGVDFTRNLSLVGGQLLPYADGYSPARNVDLSAAFDLIESPDTPTAVKGRGDELMGTAGWTIVGSWVESPTNVLTATASGTAGHGARYEGLGTVDGGTYELTYTLDITAGSVRPILYGSSTNATGTARTVSGTYTEQIKPTSAGGTFTNALLFQAFSLSPALTCVISDISLKRVEPFPGFSENGMDTEMWAVAKYVPTELNDNGIFQIVDEAGDNQVRNYLNDSPMFEQIQVTAGGVLVVNTNTSQTPILNRVNGTAFRMKANDFAASVNGTTLVTDTSCAMPSALATLRIGWAGGLGHLDGGIVSVAFGYGYLDNSDVIALSRA